MSIEYLLAQPLLSQLMPQGKCVDLDTTERTRLGAELLAGCGLDELEKQSLSLKKQKQQANNSLVARWEHSAARFFDQSLKSGVLCKVQFLKD